MILGISHVAVRTNELDLTIAFYRLALGMVEVARPASMSFPGAWIATPGETNGAMLHIYAGEAAGALCDTAADNDVATLDHLALQAMGFLTFRKRFAQLGLDWREQHREGRSIWQMFLHDPNGLKIELSFDSAVDEELPASVDGNRAYAPEERFFDPGTYGALRDAERAEAALSRSGQTWE